MYVLSAFLSNFSQAMQECLAYRRHAAKTTPEEKRQFYRETFCHYLNPLNGIRRSAYNAMEKKLEVDFLTLSCAERHVLTAPIDRSIRTYETKFFEPYIKPRLDRLFGSALCERSIVVFQKAHFTPVERLER